MTGGRDEVFLRRTGDGRYAIVDADRFGGFGGSAPHHPVAGRPGTQIALGCVKPAKPASADRYGSRSHTG